MPDLGTGDGTPNRPTLADKINQAFATLHPADRGPYSNREVVDWLREHAGSPESTISLNYLGMLRSGERSNPTVRHLQALADFFDINPAYFIEDGQRSDAVHSDLQLLAAMRDSEVRAIAARALELNPRMRTWLRDTIAGLPDGEDRNRETPRDTSRFVAPPDED